MQVSKISKFERRASYWREVISRADQFAGSGHAFCVQEGIAKSGFYSWKKKLAEHESLLTGGSKRVTKLPSVFAEVQISRCAVPVGSELAIDARWVADLILHLHRGIK